MFVAIEFGPEQEYTRAKIVAGCESRDGERREVSQLVWSLPANEVRN